MASRQNRTLAFWIGVILIFLGVGGGAVFGLTSFLLTPGLSLIIGIGLVLWSGMLFRR